MTELVAGVDGTKRGWVAVILIDGRFREARLIEGVESDFSELADMKRIAIDIPIGYGPRAGRRARPREGRRQLRVLDPRARAVRRALRRGRWDLGPGARARGPDQARHRAGGQRQAPPRSPPRALLHGDERHEAAQVPQEVRRRARSSGSGCCAGTGSTSIRARLVARRRSRSTTCSTLRRARGRPLGVMRSHFPIRPSGGTGSAWRSGTSPPGLVPVPGEVHVVLGVSGPRATPAPADRPERSHDRRRDHPGPHLLAVRVGEPGRIPRHPAPDVGVLDRVDVDREAVGVVRPRAGARLAGARARPRPGGTRTTP